MRVEDLGLGGALLLHRPLHRDARGFLVEVHQQARYAQAGIPGPFVQDNHSRSVRGVIRGLHYQRHHPQGKLVEVVRGAIVDVVADIRRGSPTFGRWVAVPLEEGTGQQLWVPPGLAHGFCVVSDVADVLYKNTDVYRPDDGRGIRWDDPTLAVDWPVSHPVLSEADAALPTLDAIDPDELPAGAG